MDFGVVGFDGFVGSESGSVSLASDPETKQKLYGSALGFRSSSKEDDLRSSKLARTDDFSSSKMTLLGSNNVFSFSDAQEHQQMLSFSSPKSESLSVERSCRRGSIPYFHSTSASARNTGYNNGGLNCGSMQGALTGVRRPFTPSQWMELEHQALIYKYIAANVSVPSNLLIPIKKSIDSAGFSSFPAGFLGPNALGWGTFPMGLSGNSDPEPGRCRRTDGKKWRCSKDAVADQKYCERHMNRGRHRSRKPVEGQAGHSVAGISASITSKLISSPSASTVVSGAGTQNTHAIPNQLLKNLPPASFHTSGSTQANRMLMEKDNGDRVQNASCFSALSSTEIALESKQTSFIIPKQQISYEASPRTEYGFVSDGFLEPSLHKNSITTCKSFGSEGETESRLHNFIWPKNQSDQSIVSWSGFDTRSDGTQLSMSTTPVNVSDLTASSAATTEKLTLSPLRLLREFNPNPIQMELGVNETSNRQSNRIPISWGSSMGGPLGEVLKHTNNNGGECKSSAALNLMTEGWDNSPPVGSSPTGVLQKTSFGSVSTSSTGSSPRADNNRINEGATRCNDLLGQLL